MQPKLKENPQEWQKFTLVMTLALGLLDVICLRRRWISVSVFIGWDLILLGLVCACWFRPGWFRGLYRGGMTISFHIGQFLGRIMLTLFFFLVLTPLGLALRLAGKDLLALKKDARATTYWHSAKKPGDLERMF